VGPASQLTITTQPSGSAPNGTPFAQQPAVQLRDASGNAVSQNGVAVTAAIASGPAGAVLSGVKTVSTSTSGTAVFTNLAITGLPGSYTLQFSSSGLTPVTSSVITVTVGSASQLTITTQPSASATNAAAFPQQPAVQLRDASGNAVSQSGVAVTAAIASGGGTLGGTTTVSTDGAGIARFTNLSLSGIIGNRTLGFSALALTGATSGTINLVAGPASQLAITTQPSGSAPNGTNFPQQPVLQLRDISGNAVSQSGVSVTAAIASGGGTLGGTTVVSTDGTGIARFSDLAISGIVGSRTLAFSAPGLAGATSGAVSLTAGPASQLSITVQPSTTATSGVPFSQQPVIQLRDTSGNLVSAAGVAVSAAIFSGPGALSGTLSVTTGASGVASFTNLALTGPGTYLLVFSSGSLADVISTGISVP
jgi:hypothetical protein